MKNQDIEDVKRLLLLYYYMGFERLPFALEALKVRKKTYHEPGTLETVEQALRSVREELGECTRCKLHGFRKTIVFGEGSEQSGLMFIGDAPGEEEDLQGRPFVGQEGSLLNSLIERMGLQRQGVYMSHLVKCRPPENRRAEAEEIATCRPFLLAQIKVIKPRVIIALGSVSSQSLLNTATPITELRGRAHDFLGVSLIPTFHPAYLLRNPKAKWHTWEDAKMALKILSETNS
jgi:DNA polymerase